MLGGGGEPHLLTIATESRRRVVAIELGTCCSVRMLCSPPGSLYLRGISTGDVQEALAAILGPGAPNLSPGVISRLPAGWEKEYERRQRRDVPARRYVYIWADGVYLQARMEPEAECILVIVGATPEGKKRTARLPCRDPGERAELAPRSPGHRAGDRAALTPGIEYIART